MLHLHLKKKLRSSRLWRFDERCCYVPSPSFIGTGPTNAYVVSGGSIETVFVCRPSAQPSTMHTSRSAVRGNLHYNTKISIICKADNPCPWCIARPANRSMCCANFPSFGHKCATVKFSGDLIIDSKKRHHSNRGKTQIIFKNDVKMFTFWRHTIVDKPAWWLNSRTSYDPPAAVRDFGFSIGPHREGKLQCYRRGYQQLSFIQFVVCVIVCSAW